MIFKTEQHNNSFSTCRNSNNGGDLLFPSTVFHSHKRSPVQVIAFFFGSRCVPEFLKIATKERIRQSQLTSTKYKHSKAVMKTFYFGL
ncbi:unnamed protein product [Amaranthus hypochondriacus]